VLEVTTAMLRSPVPLQRIAERAGRARGSRFACWGAHFRTRAGALDLTQCGAERELGATAATWQSRLAGRPGRRRDRDATQGVVERRRGRCGPHELDVAMELYDGRMRMTRLCLITADASTRIEPPPLVF